VKARTTAISREGLLATAQSGSAPHASTPLRQTLLVILGSTSIGIACSLLVHARFGLAPYDVLNSAVAARAGVSLGVAILIVTSTLFALAWLLGRPPSIVSLGFMVSVSVALSVAIPAMNDIQPTVLRLLAVPTAVVLFAFGVAVVVQATDSGGAFELLMAAGQDRGISPTLVRTILELSALTFGILAGGSFGLATVFVAVSLGPVLRFWLHHISWLVPSATHNAQSPVRQTLSARESS